MFRIADFLQNFAHDRILFKNLLRDFIVSLDQSSFFSMCVDLKIIIISTRRSSCGIWLPSTFIDTWEKGYRYRSILRAESVGSEIFWNRFMHNISSTCGSQSNGGGYGEWRQPWAPRDWVWIYQRTAKAIHKNLLQLIVTTSLGWLDCAEIVRRRVRSKLHGKQIFRFQTNENGGVAEFVNVTRVTVVSGSLCELCDEMCLTSTLVGVNDSYRRLVGSVYSCSSFQRR